MQFDLRTSHLPRVPYRIVESEPGGVELLRGEGLNPCTLNNPTALHVTRNDHPQVRSCNPCGKTFGQTGYFLRSRQMIIDTVILYIIVLIYYTTSYNISLQSG